MNAAEPTDPPDSAAPNEPDSSGPFRVGRPDRALGLTVATLVGSNLVANLALPSGWYVPWNLSVAVVLLMLALRVGRLPAAAIGFGADNRSDGARWGAAIGGVIVGGALALAAFPPTRGWFDDAVGRGGTTDVVLRVFVSIPLGTVLMEEVAFRGTLPALLERRPGWTTTRATVASAVAFGAWHVLPSRSLGERNTTMGSVFGDTLGRWAPVAAAVIATTAAGLALGWLRRRTNSVIAPMIVHWALNAAGVLAAWWVA